MGFELITAIALWCSSPHQTNTEIQACRERLLKCLTKNEQKCFETEKLK